MNFERIKQLSPQISGIAKKYGITKIYVFGSIARGDSSAHSDVDFLVEMRNEASLFGVAGFNFEVEKLLGVSVDVVPLSLLPQIKDRKFVNNITEEAIPL